MIAIRLSQEGQGSGTCPLDPVIKTVTNTDSFIRLSKTKAKQYLQGIKESSVSTANDKEVKDLAKSLRDQDRKLFEKTGERVAGGALQGVTSYGNREFDKKMKNNYAIIFNLG